jgi:RNA polymerase sigma-70 factor (ECF subfamily)
LFAKFLKIGNFDFNFINLREKIKKRGTMKRKKLGKTHEEWVQETWNSYSSQIYNLCKAKCMDGEDAKDLFQNVALRFCQNANKIMYHDSIYPWLLCVLRNCFFDSTRRKNRESPFTCVFDTIGDYMSIPLEKSVFYKPGNYPNDELDRIVNTLSGTDRELIDMQFHRGLSTRELSSMYGLSFNAVSKRRLSAIKRARRALTS